MQTRVVLRDARLLLLLLTAGCHLAIAQDNANTGCLVELEVPRFASILFTRSNGSVRADVLIGAGGTAKEIRVAGTNVHLEREVKYHLERTASYHDRCRGETIKLVFDFVVDGDESASPVIKTRFFPPNRFVISSQPPKAHILRIPIEPKPGAKE